MNVALALIVGLICAAGVVAFVALAGTAYHTFTRR